VWTCLFRSVHHLIACTTRYSLLPVDAFLTPSLPVIYNCSLGDFWVIRVIPKVARTSYSSSVLQFYHRWGYCGCREILSKSRTVMILSNNNLSPQLVFENTDLNYNYIFFSKQKVRFSAQYHSFPQSSKTTKLDIIIKCCHRSNHLTVAQLQSYWLIDRSSFAASKGGREWGGVVRLWWRRRCYNDDQQVLGDRSVAFSMRIIALNSHQGPLKL